MKETIECDECCGRGYHSGPVCCEKNLTKDGECRGDCPIEERTVCWECEGSGKREVDDEA